jgi:hypothetical protein
MDPKTAVIVFVENTKATVRAQVVANLAVDLHQRLNSDTIKICSTLSGGTGHFVYGPHINKSDISNHGRN